MLWWTHARIIPFLSLPLGNNPVITLPEDELLMLASAHGTVVNSFLTSSDFTEVMPEGVTVPPPTPFGDDDDDDGSVPLVVSMVTVLGTVLFALMSI